MTNSRTVQTPVVVDVSVTVRRDVAVGTTSWVDPPTVISIGVAKVIDWVNFAVAGNIAVITPEFAE
jgi:hypothetical protein